LDESISRFHAEIKFDESVFLLRDTGSTTGTFIKLVGKVEIIPVFFLNNSEHDHRNGKQSI